LRAHQTWRGHACIADSLVTKTYAIRDAVMFASDIQDKLEQFPLEASEFMERWARPMRCKDCHQAHNAEVLFYNA
jgi:hypothetical protein